MKALTIKQPWAYLIAAGHKDIENRTWRTNHRGRLYIHVSAKVADNSHRKALGCTGLLTSAQLMILPMEARKELVRCRFDTSAVIGHVDLMDCVKGHPSVWAEEDCWNWVLKDPFLFKEPITGVKGRLSLWDIGTDLLLMNKDIEILRQQTNY